MRTPSPNHVVAAHDRLRTAANRQVIDGFQSADPIVLDVRPAIEVVPNMKENLVLTSGAPLAWGQFISRQRRAVAGGAVHQGLASSIEDAERLLSEAKILVGSTHEFGCVGPHAGIITASTPVFVVADRATGAQAYCSVFEGDASPRRLSLGFFSEEISASLRYVEEVVAPILGAAIRESGGIALSTLIRDALELGDDGHVRTNAGTLLFTRALLPALLKLSSRQPQRTAQTLEFIRTSSYTFLRPWMAADKAVLSGADGVSGSSVVTVMTLNCREFAIQVSGLPGRWFRGPHPSFRGVIGGQHYNNGDKPPENWGWWFGADSMITECLGFGGFSAAAAFPLSGGYLACDRPQDLIKRTESMFAITLAEHQLYKIPYLDFRGVPVGIDVFKVTSSGCLPEIHGGISREDGTAFSGAVVYPPIECFEQAVLAYNEAYSGTDDQAG